MRIMTTLGIAVVLFLAMSVNSYAADKAKMPAGVKVEKTALGPVLADSKGMTFYTFDKDATPGKSACNGPCAQNWPPLAAKAGAKPMGDWTVVTRDDGSKQWAYNGKPLYTFAKDKKPGDTTGDGFLNNAWHAAKP
jgi:predicted lipoprotein with Yx(FWY)xxD motif